MTGDDALHKMSATIPPLFQASTQDDESVAQMVALLDVQDGLPSARRLQDWAIATAAVRPGDQVIDLGSGRGHQRHGPAAAERGEAFAAITVFGFVARKLDGCRGMTAGPK